MGFRDQGRSNKCSCGHFLKGIREKCLQNMYSGHFFKESVKKCLQKTYNGHFLEEVHEKCLQNIRIRTFSNGTNKKCLQINLVDTSALIWDKKSVKYQHADMFTVGATKSIHNPLKLKSVKKMFNFYLFGYFIYSKSIRGKVNGFTVRLH